MPRWIYTAIILVNMLMVIPPVLIFKNRAAKSRHPRVHLFHDMDNQKRYEPQAESSLFADGRTMRLPVAGTVARGELNRDDHLYRGIVGEDWAIGFPSQVTVDDAFLERGRERYGIYCTPCHGESGHGDGIIPRRTEVSDYGGWTVGDLAAEKARNYPVGHLFNILTNGINTMPPYRSQVSVEDRWAIVAWVRALQFSQAADFAQLSDEDQGQVGPKPKEE